MGYFDDKTCEYYVGKLTKSGEVIKKVVHSEPDGYGGFLLDVWTDNHTMFNVPTKYLEEMVVWAT